MRVTLCVFLSVCFALCFVSSFLFSFISIYSTRGNLGLLRRLMIMIIIICGSCVASSLVYLSITSMNTVEVPSQVYTQANSTTYGRLYKYLFISPRNSVVSLFSNRSGPISLCNGEA